jgi:hypothetical protein
MNNVQLQDLARIGAQARLAALDTEREELVKLFPDLGTSPQPAALKNGSPQPAARKRRGMSPAARKAHGQRMRAYWASRRAEKEGTAASPREIADASPAAANQAPGRKGMSPAARKAQGERMRAYWAAKRGENKGPADGEASGRPTLPSNRVRNAGRKK